MGALKRDDKVFTVALLACGWPNNKTYKWSDTRELMEYGLSHYTYHTFEELPVDNEMLQPVQVANGCSKRLGETAYVELGLSSGMEDQEVAEGLLLREDEHFELSYTLPDCLEAPVEEGVQVGKIEYLLGDTVYKTIAVVTKGSVPVIDFTWCFEEVWKRYIFS